MAEDIETLRRKRLKEMMQAQSEQAMQAQLQQQLEEQQIEQQIKIIMHQIMAPEARERLGNIRLVHPDFARQVEIMLIQLYQAGKLQERLTDEKFKEILKELHARKQRETKITRR